MRGSIDGLGSSAPIGAMLPAVFADDDLAQRFVGGLDDVVAPILSVLDCLDTYFRPSLAPLDFTQWLGGWVGAETEGDEPEAEDDPDHRALTSGACTPAVRRTTPSSRMSSIATAPSPGSMSTAAMASVMSDVAKPSRTASSAVDLTQ